MSSHAEECRKRGAYREIVINKDKARTTRDNAKTMMSGARKLAAALAEKDEEWLAVFLTSYDALHLLAEAYLRSKGLKATDHKCLYAYVEEQTGLKGFEELRQARNDTHYHGKKLSTEKLRAHSEQVRAIHEKLQESMAKL
ncbi:MAG: hypothetical protein ACLFO2_01180 [Candidatus Woesearchaeota archaeon]